MFALALLFIIGWAAELGRHRRARGLVAFYGQQRLNRVPNT